MPAPPVSRARIEGALAAHAAGASLAEAAAMHGVSRRTLASYKAGRGAGVARVGAKSTRPVAAPSRATKQASRVAPELPPSPALGAALEAEGESAAVLGLLRAELAHACRKRAAATQAGVEPMEARWSKRIEELGKLVERLEPPAPPGEDEVVRRLRDLDGAMIAKIEEHLAEHDKVNPADLFPSRAELEAFAERLPANLAADLRGLLDTAPPRPSP
jgi:hypothetical protein